jgi:hypothetical protein
MATFDAGSPLDNASLNEILSQIEDLKKGDLSLSASIGKVEGSVSSSATSAVAKKLLAGRTPPKPYKLTAGTEKQIKFSYSGTLTGTCAALIYSLGIDSKDSGVDVSSALISFTSDSAVISLQKTTAGTDTYMVSIHYLAVAATE